jgi:hypothetical protein
VLIEHLDLKPSLLLVMCLVGPYLEKPVASLDGLLGDGETGMTTNRPLKFALAAVKVVLRAGL